MMQLRVLRLFIVKLRKMIHSSSSSVVMIDTCLCYHIQKLIFGTSCFLSWRRYRMQ